MEVDGRGSGELTAIELAQVMRLARVSLSMHQILSIHRQLSKGPNCSEISVAALLLALGL